jgi:hypothetical protein
MSKSDTGREPCQQPEAYAVTRTATDYPETLAMRLALTGPAAQDQSPSGAVTRALASGLLRKAVA